MNNEKNKKIFPFIAGIAGLIIIGYGIFVYLFVFPSEKKNEAANPTETVTSFDPSKVRLDLESGAVSTDKVLNLSLRLSGLENNETIEELTKNDNLKLEINKNRAEILETQISNGNALIVLAKIQLSEDDYNKFSSGQMQNLEVRADMLYDAGKTATQMLSTSFTKKGATTSLGEEISFGNPNEKNVAGTTDPKQTPAPKQPTQNTVKKADNSVKSIPPPPRVETTTRSTPPRITPSSPPTRRSEDEEMIDDMKRNKVIRKDGSNSSQ